MDRRFRVLGWLASRIAVRSSHKANRPAWGVPRLLATRASNQSIGDNNQNPLENRNNLRSSSPHPGRRQTSGEPRRNFVVRDSKSPASARRVYAGSSRGGGRGLPGRRVVDARTEHRRSEQPWLPSDEFRTAKLWRGSPDVCPGPGCGEDNRRLLRFSNGSDF